MNSPEPTDISVGIVSTIIERRGINGTEVLIQTRLDPEDPKYSGTLEIPAGRIDGFENVYHALKREVLEETGLHVTKIKPEIRTKTFSPHDDESFAFVPFCCQQQTKGGQPEIGFVFICEVENKKPTPQKGETQNIQWIEKSKLKQMIKDTPEKFYTLQRGPLDYYLNHNRGEINIA